MKTEKQKFLDYVEDQIINTGLIDIKFVMRNDFEEVKTYGTAEEFYAEANRILAAPTLPDTDFF